MAFRTVMPFLYVSELVAIKVEYEEANGRAAGHKTRVSLEDAFWNSLKEIASGRNMNSLPAAEPPQCTMLFPPQPEPFALPCLPGLIDSGKDKA